MDEISNYNRRQYQRIRHAIANFERAGDSLHNLIADLEVLLAGLEGAPPDRREAFHQAWDKLREIHVAAVVDKRPQPTSSQDIVKSALASMTALLASVPRLPCPSCGFLVFNQLPGSFDFCPICLWQDDVVQLRFPDYAGGANKPALFGAPQNFSGVGASQIPRPVPVGFPPQEQLPGPPQPPMASPPAPLYE